MRYLVALALTLIFFRVDAFADGAPIASPDGFIAEGQEASKLRKPDLDALKRIRMQPSTRRATALSIDTTPLLSTVATLAIPGGPILQLRKSKEDRHSDSTWTWYGKIDSGGDAIISVQGNQIFGTITTPGHHFLIRSLNDRIHVLIEINPNGFPPDHPATAPSLKSPPPTQVRSQATEHLTSDAVALASTATPVLNVYVAFTPGAVTYFGNASLAAQTAISSLNQSFSNSVINLSANLAGTISVATEYSSSSDALQGAINSNSIVQGRNSSNADIVILVGAFSDACGVSKQILATARTAFASVSDTCLIGNYSMAHEIGHLLGARHDIADDATSTPFSNGHGYQLHNTIAPDCVHDIMAYPQSCAGDIRVNLWSSSVNVYDAYNSVGGRINVYLGDPNTANIASFLGSTGANATAFRQTKLQSGIAAAMSTFLGAMFVFDD